MDSKDLLFDMWFLEAEENEELKKDIEDLEDENDELREELEKRKASELVKNEEDLNNDIDLDEATYFAEDVQTIAANNGKYMEISVEEARKAINLGFTPEEYYDYKINN